MKMRAFALVLALCMALALLPVPASAAAVQPMPAPTLQPQALPTLPVQPQAGQYTITMTSTGNGTAELYATSADVGESVYFLADPEPGYKVSFEKCGYHYEQHRMELYYIGGNVYEMVMPDGDVILDLEFVKIESSSHNVKLTVGAGGTAAVDQSSAKKGESLFVAVVTGPGYSDPAVWILYDGQRQEGYYLGREGEASIYEVLMPDADAEILVDFTRNGPFDITTHITGNGTIRLSHTTAYELETVTITAVPDRGHEVTAMYCGFSGVTKKGNNVWTFAMPRFDEEVYVTFAPVNYPVFVTCELPMGGNAFLDRETANIGQTVTLTCVPDEGYRVARITGAELTDNGDNTYTFVVDNQPVELKVLFLREENPFLDVNETHFFYESVLWAAEEGITSGINATDFGPFGVCNRAQVVTFLWRAAGSPAPAGTEIPFEDVPAGTWYSDAVLWAVEQGITNGLTATTFGPDAVCNRAQVVTFLHRACASPAPALEENPFTDVAEDAWYHGAVLWAVENGVTTGASATTFHPGGECLRAQVVTFLYRADQIPEPEPEPEPFPDLG